MCKGYSNHQEHVKIMPSGIFQEPQELQPVSDQMCLPRFQDHYPTTNIQYPTPPNLQQPVIPYTMLVITLLLGLSFQLWLPVFLHAQMQQQQLGTYPHHHGPCPWLSDLLIPCQLQPQLDISVCSPSGSSSMTSLEKLEKLKWQQQMQEPPSHLAIEQPQ